MISVRSIQAALFAVVVVVAAMASDARPAIAGTCGVITTPWPIPADDPDCDGFSSTLEPSISTYPYATCGAGDQKESPTNLYDEDSWPLDFNDDGAANVTDILAYKGRAPHPVPPEPKRLDLNNDNWITVVDVLKFKGRIPGSCVLGPTPPAASQSWYITTLDPGIMAQHGCIQAVYPPDDSLVILHFGQPWWDGATFGANLHDYSATFKSTAEIEQATKDYLSGYWQCSGQTNKHVTVAIGTSNYKGGSHWGVTVTCSPKAVPL